MIIMDIKVDNLYAFKNFHMNMSYPKKIVGSTIEQEYLPERTNFRYKKVNIIMGGNATGKTSLGRLLMLFTNYFNDGGFRRFTDRIADKDKKANLTIDFVTDLNILYRFDMEVFPKKGEKYTEEEVKINIFYTPIGNKDNYEICAKKIDNNDCEETSYDKVETNGWSFSYPIDVVGEKIYRTIEESDKYLYILKQILKTLDPSVEEVMKVNEVENTYVIKWENCSAIIKDGKIANGSVMSSGTKAGLDISYVITSLICNMHDLYYCDELFSYVNSDVEKACLSIIIERLKGRKQLFFTTHNSDILDMQLPKHSFTFLKKNVENGDKTIKCISASEYLKRNTDSLKSAVENDLFCISPELNRLYEIADL
ncbi:AAA family ATPase [Eubacterium sp.]